MRLQLLLSILSLSTITAAGAGVGAWVGTKVFNFEKGMKAKTGDVSEVEKAKIVEENLKPKLEENNVNLETQITNSTTPLNTQNEISTHEISEKVTDIKVESLNPQQLLQPLETNVIQITKGQNNEKTVYTLSSREEQQQNSVILKQEKGDPYKTSSNNVMNQKLLDEEEKLKLAQENCEKLKNARWDDGSLDPTKKPGCIIDVGTDGVIDSSTLLLF